MLSFKEGIFWTKLYVKKACDCQDNHHSKSRNFTELLMCMRVCVCACGWNNWTVNISVFCCIKFSSHFTLLAGERPQCVTVYRSNVKKDVIKIFSDSRIFSYSFDVVANSVPPIFVQRVQYFSIADMVVKRCIVNHANN